jgi:DNA polymerase-3 subunit beta
LGLRGGDGTAEIYSTVDLAGEHESGLAMFDGKPLLDLCNTLGDSVAVHFLQTGQEITVSSESPDMKFKLNAGSGNYPKLDVSEIDSAPLVSLDVPAKLLRRLINKTLFLVSREAGHRPALQGMLLELREGELCGVTTDAQCLALCKVSVPGCKADEEHQYIIPRVTLEGMNRLLSAADPDSTTKLSLGAGTMVMEVGHERMSSKLIDAQFPDYKRVLNHEFDKKLIMSKTDVDKAMDRVNVVFHADHIGPSGCTFTVKDNSLNLRSRNSNGTNNFEANISIKQKEGEDITLMLNTAFVKNGINIFEEEELQFFFTEPKEGVQVAHASENRDILYMMMPMSL